LPPQSSNSAVASQVTAQIATVKQQIKSLQDQIKSMEQQIAEDQKELQDLKRQYESSGAKQPLPPKSSNPQDKAQYDREMNNWKSHRSALLEQINREQTKLENDASSLSNGFQSFQIRPLIPRFLFAQGFLSFLKSGICGRRRKQGSALIPMKNRERWPCDAASLTPAQAIPGG
jgi:ATPase subunit of ABC transporter with duplicated ATPase domains